MSELLLYRPHTSRLYTRKKNTMICIVAMSLCSSENITDTLSVISTLILCAVCKNCFLLLTFHPLSRQKLAQDNSYIGNPTQPNPTRGWTYPIHVHLCFLWDTSVLVTEVMLHEIDMTLHSPYPTRLLLSMTSTITPNISAISPS